jgi:hypothetical protein
VSHFGDRDIAWNFWDMYGTGGCPIIKVPIQAILSFNGTLGHVSGDMGVPSLTKKGKTDELKSKINVV